MKGLENKTTLLLVIVIVAVALIGAAFLLKGPTEALAPEGTVASVGTVSVTIVEPSATSAEPTPKVATTGYVTATVE